MFADFLEALRVLVSRSEAPKVVGYGDPRTILVSANGTLSEKVIPPDLRKHSILHLQDFIDAANRYGGDTGVIFHSPARIVLVVDDNDRRDLVSMSLQESGTFQFLRSLKDKSVFDQRTFVQILKTTLRDHVNPGLLPEIRKMDVSTGSKTSGEIAHGRERGTREFQAELANAANVPEILDVVVSVYSNSGLRHDRTVRCTLDVELPSLAFRLFPLPDEIDFAVEDAQEELHKLLVDGVDSSSIEVFRGAP